MTASAVSAPNDPVRPWAVTQIRQVSVRRSGQALTVSWQGEEIRPDKRGRDPREVTFSNGETLSLPAVQVGALPNRLPAELTLHDKGVVTGRLSLEQTLNLWVTRKLIAHSDANDFAYLLRSSDLTGTFPSVQPVGQGALAILVCYRPMDSGYVPLAFYLVRLIVTPELRVLPLRKLDGIGGKDDPIPSAPRLFLLHRHLLLQTGHGIEAIQPDGTAAGRARRIVRKQRI